MNETGQNSINSAKPVPNEIGKLWDGVIAFHRSEVTVLLALFLGWVTVTGFAVQNNSPYLCWIAVLIAVFGFCIDYSVKRFFIAPFFYKILSLEIKQKQDEPLGFLFGDFGAGKESRIAKILQQPPGPERQTEFLKALMRKRLVHKIIIFGFGVAIEIFIFLWLRGSMSWLCL